MSSNGQTASGGDTPATRPSQSLGETRHAAKDPNGATRVGIFTSINAHPHTHDVKKHSQYEPRVLLLLPIQQVPQKIDKSRLGEDVLLCEGVKVEGVCECLYELELELEACPVYRSGVVGRRIHVLLL